MKTGGASGAPFSSTRPGESSGLIRRLVSSRLMTSIFVLSLLLAGSCLYIWQRVRALDLIAEVSLLEKVNREYRDQLLKVEADVVQLESLSRIDSLAQEQFGLRRAQLGRVYAVRFPEQSVGENGIRELWGALRKSFAGMPTIESAEVAAQELFEESE
ncbi:MAG: hypothetical protein ACE5GA_05430 [Candidatus Zixiibacteriota bacterium]